MTLTRQYKLAFLGSPGAGKTTCIGAISDLPPLVTDVRPTDELRLLKETTTIAFDYGEITLENGERLLLYGLPGQTRFTFMADVVRDGLVGVVVLVDGTTAHAVQDLRDTLSSYQDLLRGNPFVVGLNKLASPSHMLSEQCRDVLDEYGFKAPVCTLDARQLDDVVRVVKLILMIDELGGPAAKPESVSWN